MTHLTMAALASRVSLALAPDGEFGAQSLGYVVVRWVTYIGLLGVVGALVFRAAVLGRVHRHSRGDAEVVAFARRAFGLSRVWAIGAAGLLLLGTGLRLVAQLRAVYGDMAGDAGLTSALLGGTTWGWAWITQAIAATVALVVVLGRPRESAKETRALAIVSGVAAVVLAGSAAASGHAASVDPTALAVMSDAIHVLAAGGWIGTLALVAFVGIPAAKTPASPGTAATATSDDGAVSPTSGADLVRHLILTFSNVALVCATIIVLTGITSAWAQMRSLGALWSTPYGQVLLVKLALLTLVAAAGAYNWRVATPRLLEVGGVRRIRRAVAAELGFAVAVLAATAVLVATPPPVDAMVIEQPEPWTTARAERRLSDAGIDARRLPATGPHFFMSVPATSYELANRDEVQVFIYPDTASRARDVAKLDPQRVAPHGMMIKRRAKPSLLIDGNMAVIVLTNDEVRRGRVHDALLGSGEPR